MLKMKNSLYFHLKQSCVSRTWHFFSSMKVSLERETKTLLEVWNREKAHELTICQLYNSARIYFSCLFSPMLECLDIERYNVKELDLVLILDVITKLITSKPELRKASDPKRNYISTTTTTNQLLRTYNLYECTTEKALTLYCQKACHTCHGQKMKFQPTESQRSYE